MGIARDAALLFGPAHHRRGPGRPALRRTVGAGIELILQAKQTNVPQCLRAEAADLQVVLEDRARVAQLMRAWREKTPLIVEAGTPGEYAADIQPFAFDLSEHVLRQDAFGGTVAVGAAGGMDVMVA